MVYNYFNYLFLSLDYCLYNDVTERKRKVVCNIGKEMYLYILNLSKRMLFSVFLLPSCYSLNLKNRLMCSLLIDYKNHLPLLPFSGLKAN